MATGRVYYHGSSKRFDQFSVRQSKRGKAIFLTEDPRDARSYGKFVYTLELDASTRLFDYQDPDHIAKLTAWVEAVLNKPTKSEDYRTRPSFYPFTWEKVLDSIKKGAYQALGHPIITTAIKALKFDGWHELENSHTAQVGIMNTNKIKVLDVHEYGENQWPTRNT